MQTQESFAGQCSKMFKMWSEIWRSSVASFMLTSTVKEVWKSANYCQSYEPMSSGMFFWLTV